MEDPPRRRVTLAELREELARALHERMNSDDPAVRWIYDSTSRLEPPLYAKRRLNL